jgi:hypothetical protein
MKGCKETTIQATIYAKRVQVRIVPECAVELPTPIGHVHGNMYALTTFCMCIIALTWYFTLRRWRQEYMIHYCGGADTSTDHMVVRVCVMSDL